MIKSLKVTNFRSILESYVDLNNLTVFVGANASGKSNIMKALEFVRDATTDSLDDAVLERGGFAELLPKQISKPGKEVISFELSFTVKAPAGWKKYNLPELVVDYSFSFCKKNNNKVKIVDECIIFKDPLLIGKFLRKKIQDRSSVKVKNEVYDFSEYMGSEIKIIRKSNSKSVDISHNIDLNKQNIEALSEWIGVRRMFDSSKHNYTKTQIISIIKTFIEYFDIKPAESSNYSESTLLLSNRRSIFRFNEHYRETINTLNRIRRYDLFLNELRSEQKSKEARIYVNSEGNNIPTVSNQLMKKQSWNEIISTMTSISPYFAGVSHKRLRGGKEYIAFNEIFNGREIESWESSDGTLRAFAILVAIEAHDAGSTVLVEEPEHGLHPWAIPYLIRHIKASISKKNIQILITTHSPQVLENIDASELLIVDRNMETGTTFKTIEQVTGISDPHMDEIGTLWVRGMLNGVPSY